MIVPKYRKKAIYVVPRKEIELKKSQNLLQASIDFASEIEIGQQQIDIDRDPDLGHDIILGGSKRILDL